MDEVSIRAAAKGDVVVLAKLMTELGYPTSTEAMSHRLEEISADSSYRALVAERDGHVLGMVGLHKAQYTVRKRPYAHGHGCKTSSLPQLRVPLASQKGTSGSATYLPRWVNSLLFHPQPRTSATIPVTIAPAASSLLGAFPSLNNPPPRAVPIRMPTSLAGATWLTGANTNAVSINR